MSSLDSKDDLAKMANVLEMPKTAEIERIVKEQVVPACARSTEVFCRVFYADVFTEEFEEGQREYIKSLDDALRGHRVKLCQVAFRGFGKSTITEAFLAKVILFMQRHFIIYASATADLAETQTEVLRSALMGNPKIRRVFPSIRTKRQRGLSEENFGKKHWVANANTFVLPRGPGQQVNGLRNPLNGKRPDLIACDDFERRKEVGSERLRKKVQDWLFGVLFLCPPQHGKENYTILYSDTLKHKQSALVKMEKSSGFEYKSYPLCDENFKTFYPNLFPQDEVTRTYDEYKGLGMLPLFYREKLNKIIHGDDQGFKAEYFQSYDEKDLTGLTLSHAVLVDPAKTVTPQAADSAIVGVSIDQMNHRIYVRDVISDKLYPDELVKAAFQMADGLAPTGVTVAYEVTGLNEFIINKFETGMRETGKWYYLVELKPRTQREELHVEMDLSEKAMRVAALLPFYRKRQVFHNPAVCQKLESQLLDFPEPDLWDVCDALSYIVQLMQKELRFFHYNKSVDIPRLEDTDAYIRMQKNYLPPIKPARYVH